jgi:hypothetical protein
MTRAEEIDMARRPGNGRVLAAQFEEMSRTER